MEAGEQSWRCGTGVDDGWMVGNSVGLFCEASWTSLQHELYEVRVTVDGVASVHEDEQALRLFGRCIAWGVVKVAALGGHACCSSQYVCFTCGGRGAVMAMSHGCP